MARIDRVRGGAASGDRWLMGSGSMIDNYLVYMLSLQSILRRATLLFLPSQLLISEVSIEYILCGVDLICDCHHFSQSLYLCQNAWSTLSRCRSYDLTTTFTRLVTIEP